MGPVLAGNHHHVLPYRDEHLSLDFDQQAASLDAERMTLTRKEYDLLALLVQHVRVDRVAPDVDRHDD